ncbi:MAG: AraC family transcriptional regulator [bacterium]
MKLNMPKQTCQPIDRDRVQHDLASIGLPDVPLLGIHDEKVARKGLGSHVHKGLMEICYLTRGERIYHVNRQDYPFRGSEVFVTFPDEVHGSGRHPHGKALLYWMQVRLPVKPAPFLTLSARDAWPLVQRLRALPHRRFLGDRRLKTLFEEILSAYLHGDRKLVRLEAGTRLVQWLMLVVRSAEVESERLTTPDIRRVLKTIEESLDQSITMNTLAQTAGLSPSRFKAKFKEQTGVPPGEYVIRKKVEKAREWLGQGRSVTDVAFALGFSTTQYFATTFKRILNLRPRDVKRGKGPKHSFTQSSAGSHCGVETLA